MLLFKFNKFLSSLALINSIDYGRVSRTTIVVVCSTTEHKCINNWDLGYQLNKKTKDTKKIEDNLTLKNSSILIDS